MTPSTKGINFIANEYDLKTASLANLCRFKLLCNTVEEVEFPLVLDEKTLFFLEYLFREVLFQPLEQNWYFLCRER